jgi:hypothetical protein
MLVHLGVIVVAGKARSIEAVDDLKPAFLGFDLSDHVLKAGSLVGFRRFDLIDELSDNDTSLFLNDFHQPASLRFDADIMPVFTRPQVQRGSSCHSRYCSAKSC